MEIRPSPDLRNTAEGTCLGQFRIAYVGNFWRALKIWEDTPQEYRIKEITRVNFGGDYENALYLVGGVATIARVSRT